MANNKDRLINISDLAKIIGLVDPKSGKPLTHTLRFWESKFTQIKPTILSGNRRYYSEKDINTVKMINYLLKDRGLTIRGAISAMKEKGNKLNNTVSSRIKTEYYKNKIKLKSKIILSKIKKLNG